jgi:cold shock CspA family protein
MTGRIELLSTDDSAGYIRAEDGVKVSFRVSEVKLRDATDLAVGQMVTFDMERSQAPRAFNIRVEKRHYNAHEKDKLWQAIRYVGFEQTGNIRLYKFERQVPREEAVSAIVSADMALFLKHKIGIQDGPMLCLRLVVAEIEGTNASEDAPYRRSLTDHDMLCHLAARRAPEKRFGRRPGRTTTLPPTHAWRGTGPRTTS